MVISGVWRGFFQKHNRLPEREATDTQEDRDHPDNVFPDLTGKEIVGLGLNFFHAAPEGSGRASLTEQEQMQSREPHQGRRKNHDVNDEEATQRHLAWRRAALQEALAKTVPVAGIVRFFLWLFLRGFRHCAACAILSGTA